MNPDNPIKIQNEEEYQEALAFIDELWGIEQYLDLGSQRDAMNMFLAVEEYEDEHYPIGV